MSTIALRRRQVTTLDYKLLRRLFVGLGLALLVISPVALDPIAFAVGGLVPCAVLWIIGIPRMPAAVPYFLLWQWGQAFSRVVLTLVDGESLSRGVYGANVERAYWYVLASVIVLALAFRLMMANLREPSAAERTAHLRWPVNDLFLAYCAAEVFSVACGYASNIVPGLDQQFEALAYLKVIALFMLFTNVMMTGQGGRILVGVVLFEVAMGFTGLLSGFRSVFFYLAIAAFAARIRFTGLMALGAVVWITILLGLALFWTAIKTDYRATITGSDQSQWIKTSVGSRFGYLGGRVAAAGDINWGDSSYALLSRLAYIDIFGAVIGVAEVSPEQGFIRQWRDATEHVLKPRILFPDKAALSDTDVYVRLARGDAAEEIRLGTSISVGYISENFVDLGFPGMLGGIFVIGLVLSGICRFFMTRKIPWMMREAIVLAFLYSVGHDGVEMSLPKMFGATLMFFIIYAVLVKFGLPTVLRWLDGRWLIRRRQLS